MFCGYSMPHPSEPVVNVRLQTAGRPAAAVFREGLSALAEAADHMAETFEAAVAAGPVDAATLAAVDAERAAGTAAAPGGGGGGGGGAAAGGGGGGGGGDGKGGKKAAKKA